MAKIVDLEMCLSFSYCDHFLSHELDAHTYALLQDLVRFQDKQFSKDPVKAKARRRYVVGLREVKKFLNVKKVKAVLVAPDLEDVPGKSELAINVCHRQEIKLKMLQTV